MRNALLIVSIIAMSAGVSQADRFHGSRGGGARVVDHRGPAGGARFVDHRGPVRYEGHGPVRYEGRGDVRYEARHDVRFGGRGYYEGPRVHYYNRWQRPGLYVEHYDVRPGFIWVHGDWAWDGYEWIWTPGHYVREPAYYGYGYGY
jgi:hypothetical protein